MINLKRNKKKLYLCKRIENDTKFNKPIFFKLNYVPTNSVGEMISFGENYSMFLKITCSPKEAQNFKQGDKCYVYVTPPKTHDPLCLDADYIVTTNPMITINEAQVNLRRLSGEE